MRIIIDTRPLLDRDRGGVGAYTAGLLAALLAEPKHDYALFSNAWRGIRNDELPSSSKISRHYSGSPNKILNAGFAFLGYPDVERLAGAADAVYLPNLNFIATKKPLIATVHDLSFVRYPEFFSAKQRLWHRLVNAKKLLRRAAAVIAVSEHTKADVIEMFGVPAERISVISPGVSPEFRTQEKQATEATRAKFGLKNPYFLFLGTLEPRKNVEGLIAAFERTRVDADLVIAGGRGWLDRNIFALAGRSPRRDRIRFLGYVPDADKPALYSAAVALVYPSFYEGFGMPPLEAMACGTPVIASLASSLGEVVGNAGLLVDPRNIDEIASAMGTVAEDAALRSTLRTRGIARARRFTWQESANKLERVFDSFEKAKN